MYGRSVRLQQEFMANWETHFRRQQVMTSRQVRSRNTASTFHGGQTPRIFQIRGSVTAHAAEISTFSDKDNIRGTG